MKPQSLACAEAAALEPRWNRPHIAAVPASNGPRLKTLDARSRRLLRDLIACYIEGGEPVASGRLARECGLDLSPATVRNILAELEAGGLIRSPHTSAGRIPTPQGYRLFVDSLIQIQQPAAPLVEEIKSRLPSTGAPEDVLRSASRLLSELTECAGIVSVPKRDHLALRQVEFVQLGPRRLLVILVFDDGQVQNRLVQTERPFEAAQLDLAARAINERFTGQRLSEIQASLQADLHVAKGDLDCGRCQVFDAVGQAFHAPPGEALMISGESRLAAHAELADVGQLRGLIDAFERQRDLLELVEHSVRADDVRLFIGEESGFKPFAACAVITAPYHQDGKPIGVLGVIGPTRLNYPRVIPIVRAAAQAVGAALNTV